MSDAPILSWYAAITRGDAIACQKRSQPMPAVLSKIVESGINATRLK